MSVPALSVAPTGTPETRICNDSLPSVSARSADTVKPIAWSSPATKAPFRTGYLIMMTNPKAVLFFGSILTAFIPPDGPTWLMIAITLQVGALGAILNIIAALFFSSPAVIRGFQRASFATSILFGVLFVGLGLLVTWDVVKSLSA